MKTLWCTATLFFTTLAGANASPAQIRSVAATGPNDFCGQRLFALPSPLDQVPIGFSQVGVFNPDPAAQTAIPLTAQNCTASQVLVTTVDPGALAGVGVPLPDSRLLNVPLRDVPKVIGLDGLRGALPYAGLLPPNPLPPTLSEPSYAITLGDWTEAQGKLRLRCQPDGAWVRVKLRGLIPGGVYSLWAIWMTTPPGGAMTTLPLPFGGVPNALVPDHRGRAEFSRSLAHCPLEPTPDGSLLLWITLAYHADGGLYGAAPEAASMTATFLHPSGAFVSPLGLTNHQDQLAFPVNVTRLNGSQP